MNKKFLSLAPLLAIAAFAFAPAAAQAVPHFYKSGVIIPEGTLEDEASSGLDVIAWGTLTLNNANLGPTTCENNFGADIKNPVGGGAGENAVDAFSVYDCVAPGCEALGKKLEIIPLGLTKFEEWPSVLIEEPAGTIRDEVKGIKFLVICPGAIEVEFKGALKPKVKNGTSPAAPSKVEFDAASGTLESAVGPGETSGKLKIMGYEGSEVISTKNP